ncbi:MAG: hypothetical protein HW378_4551, partial [Anaerolineales bacterium]|nr:hypothetical protein [Anaerolineales bacterium]
MDTLQFMNWGLRDYGAGESAKRILWRL